MPFFPKKSNKKKNLPFEVEMEEKESHNVGTHFSLAYQTRSSRKQSCVFFKHINLLVSTNEEIFFFQVLT